jgi:pectate lyase
MVGGLRSGAGGTGLQPFSWVSPRRRRAWAALQVLVLVAAAGGPSLLGGCSPQSSTANPLDLSLEDDRRRQPQENNGHSNTTNTTTSQPTAGAPGDRTLASDGMASAAIPAFPTAQGFGAYSFGGRGDPALGQAPRILRVTTLQDRVWNAATNSWRAAAGSLREAVEASGPRFVVFEVSGTIVLDAELEIRNPYLTIAGQTAPAGGVALAHRGIRVRTHNVVLRYLRLRLYFDDTKDWLNGRFMDGMILYRNDFEIGDVMRDPVHNVVIDHCSITWGIDENVNTWNWVKTFTLQWSIVAEGARYGHENGPEGLGWLTDVDASSTDPKNLTKATLHHNLFMHNTGRNPLITAGHTWDFRNNVVYNWTISQPAQFRSAMNVNFVGNYYIAGLDTSTTPQIRNTIDLADPNLDPARPRLHIRDNLGPLRTSGTQPDWDIGVAYYRRETGGLCGQPLGTYCIFYVTNTGEMPLYELTAPAAAPAVTTQAPAQAKDLVLQNVGASLPARDAVDARLTAEVAYVIDTRPFERTDAGYNPQTDPQLRHVGANNGSLGTVLWFRPQNDPGLTCLPRVYRIRAGQTELQAKQEMLSRMTCTFPDGLQLPNDAAAVLADPVTYQWSTFQANLPDEALVRSLYPDVSNPARPVDTDGDSMPDAFEAQHGTDPGRPDGTEDRDADGYLNIEEYLNSLAP